MEYYIEEQAIEAKRIMRNELCKNSVLEITPQDKKFLLENTGCKNVRRHCSAFCQECSDKHNGK